MPLVASLGVFFDKVTAKENAFNWQASIRVVILTYSFPIINRAMQAVIKKVADTELELIMLSRSFFSIYFDDVHSFERFLEIHVLISSLTAHETIHWALLL